MNKSINIANQIKVIEQITVFKENLYENMDIRFINVHLNKINNLLPHPLFRKNDLFINSKTLWELMQPIGNSGSHNYHELTPEDIYYALKGINEPKYILKAKVDRFAIIPIFISSFNLPLMVVIEKGAELINKKNANINKIVTIYPKGDIDSYVQKLNDKDILYIKK